MQQKTQPALEEVQRQFDDWRRRKGRRDRIPEALWKAAVSLSAYHSTHQISKLLHLNHTALRDRVTAYKSDTGIHGVGAPAFMEFGMIPPTTFSECAIEMEKPGGVKMKICFRGNYTDIVELSKALWGEH